MWLVDRCACRICVHSVCQVSLKLDDFTFLLHRRPCDVTIVHTYITMTMLKPYIAQLYSQVKLITSIILLQSNVLLGNLSLLLWMTQILLQTKNTPPLGNSTLVPAPRSQSDQASSWHTGTCQGLCCNPVHGRSQYFWVGIPFFCSNGSQCICSWKHGRP